MVDEQNEHVFFKFCVQLGNTTKKETYKMPKQCTLRGSVKLFEWFTSCEDGSTSMEDDPGPDNQLTSQ